MTRKTSNTTLAYLILGIFTILLFVVYQFQTPRYNWEETYQKDTKDQPYATGILYELLQGYFPNQEFSPIKKSIQDEVKGEGTNTNYVYIGERFYLREDDAAHLLEFIESGNTAFIASKDFPNTLMQALYKGDCSGYTAPDEYSPDNYLTEEDLELLTEEQKEFSTSLEEALEDSTLWEMEEGFANEEYSSEADSTFVYEEDVEAYDIEKEAESTMLDYLDFWEGTAFVRDSTASFNYTHPYFKQANPYPYEYKFMVKDEAENRDWTYFEQEALCSEGIDHAVLGNMNGEKVNFVKISFGEGNVYLHSEPFLFSNYHVKETAGIEYAGRVFSHLPEGDMLWDAKSHKYMRRLSQAGALTSSLKYILSQRSLRWAWYLLLTMGILYILFRAKRQQRVIPVLAGNKNSSLEFIKTVGRLYFLQNDHKKLAQRKMQLFLAYVREHFLIPTHQIDQAMKERLAVKSEVPLEIIEEIFLRYQRVDRATEVSSSHLVNFHQIIEKFYTMSK